MFLSYWRAADGIFRANNQTILTEKSNTSTATVPMSAAPLAPAKSCRCCTRWLAPSHARPHREQNIPAIRWSRAPTPHGCGFSGDSHCSLRSAGGGAVIRRPPTSLLSREIHHDQKQEYGTNDRGRGQSRRAGHPGSRGTADNNRLLQRNRRCRTAIDGAGRRLLARSEEHTSELQSPC